MIKLKCHEQTEKLNKTKKAYSAEKVVQPNLLWTKSGPISAVPPTTALTYTQTLSLFSKFSKAGLYRPDQIIFFSGGTLVARAFMLVRATINSHAPPVFVFIKLLIHNFLFKHCKYEQRT